jgi:hypothetical protein
LVGRSAYLILFFISRIPSDPYVCFGRSETGTFLGTHLLNVTVYCKEAMLSDIFYKVRFNGRNDFEIEEGKNGSDKLKENQN